MKFSAAIVLTCLASASAFAPQSSLVSKRTSLAMSDETELPLMAQEESIPKATTPVPAQSKMSESLPFMSRPMALDGTLAGDAGFDPFGFAKDGASLMKYREAEIKHARLAMLAAAGWPMSELFNQKFASTVGAPSIVDATDRAPSVLNGGLGKISPVYWVVCLVAAAAIEAYGFSQANKADYFPGNLGFDPLGLYPKDAEGQRRLQTNEIKNGRLAMIAITAFAVQEFVSKLGVVEETPFFFKPVGVAMKEYANQGYISH